MNSINQKIVDEWKMRGNCELHIVCIKAIWDYLFIDLRVIFCCLFTSYFLSCFCFGFSNIQENMLASIIWVIQATCYWNLPNTYYECAGKSLCMWHFDAEKLHSRVQASIFRLFVLIIRWTLFIFREVASHIGVF